MLSSEVYRIAAMVLNTKPRMKAAARSAERGKVGKCLHCDAKPFRRGVCVRHYFMFRRTVQAAGSEEARIKIDRRSVRNGKILPAQQGRRATGPNPFLEG